MLEGPLMEEAKEEARSTMG